MVVYGPSFSRIARDEAGFMQLWDEYQVEALARFKKANGGKLKDMVLWTSHMTEPQYLKYLDPSIYTVQYWEHGENKQVHITTLQNNP